MLMKNKIMKKTEKPSEETALTTVPPQRETQEPPAEKKLTIYDYEQKYTKRQNTRGIKLCVRMLIAVFAILIFVCLFFFTMRIWDINMYAGIGTGVVCVLLYIVFFIVPVCKIMRSDYFITNVNAQTARAAQKHNRELRHNISEKIIDFTAKVENVGWYDSYTVGQLAISLKAGDEKGISRNLTALYKGSIKRSGKDLIFRSSMKSAMYSVMSKTNTIDAVLVAFVNLQLIKDLVFLYGFRPSEARLVKIFARVLQNSLFAYGLEGAQIGSSVVKTMGDVVKGIPLLGTAISSIIDSSVQGLANGALTAVIGFQTIKYLAVEYKLQDILDGIELEEEEELAETCEEIEKELRKKKAPHVA